MSSADIIESWNYQSLVPSDFTKQICIKAGGVTVGGFDAAMRQYLAHHIHLPKDRETVFSWLGKREISKEDALRMLDVFASYASSNYAIAVVGFSPTSALYQMISEYEPVFVVDPDDDLIEHRIGMSSGAGTSRFVLEQRWDEDFIDGVLQNACGSVLAVSKSATRDECRAALGAWENGLSLVYRVDDEADCAAFFAGLEEANKFHNSMITDYAYVLEQKQDGMRYTITFKPYEVSNTGGEVSND